jgi:hypothetical protein
MLAYEGCNLGLDLLLFSYFFIFDNFLSKCYSYALYKQNKFHVICSFLTLILKAYGWKDPFYFQQN